MSAGDGIISSIMREAERLSSVLAVEAASKAVEPSDKPWRVARPARVWAAVIVVLTLLNLALAIWYVVRTGDWTSFLSHQMLTPFLSLIYAYLGVLIITRRPKNPIGWIFLVVSSSYVLSAFVAEVLLYTPFLTAALGLRILDLAIWLNNWVWLPAQLLPLTFVFLLFPDGHLPSPRWQIVGWAAGLSLLSLIVALALHPGPVGEWATLPNPFGISGAESILNPLLTLGSALLVVGVLGSMAAIVVRFRRSHGVERAQMKWLVYAAVIILIVGMFTIPLWLAGNLAETLALELSIVLTNLMTLGIAVAVTLAIVGYRLYDIDVLINRTLVYSVMTGVVLLIYGLVVGAAGVLFDSQGRWLLTLLATGLVAVLFQPIHSRLQRGVNRLLYGQRDEPFAVLSQLGNRLEQTISPGAIYPTIVETVAQALRLPYVALQVREGEEFITVEATGRPVSDPTNLPLTNGGEIVGRLLIGRRPGDNEFSAADMQLLQNIARQAGAAVHGAKLTADLQRSRQQIVTSREEERRRLRRDLHDGLGPSLASLLMEARVLRRLIRDDPAAAESLVEEIQTDIRATIDDVRRVVNELRPPALDDLGLVAALQVMADKLGRSGDQSAPGLMIQIDAPADLPPLPAAVEVAAYRIVQEGLTNILHHAHARQVTVCLRFNHDLTIEVGDDGVGFRARRAGGVGLISMRERASELGGRCDIISPAAGGTIIRATLPLPMREDRP